MENDTITKQYRQRFFFKVDVGQVVSGSRVYKLSDECYSDRGTYQSKSFDTIDECLEGVKWVLECFPSISCITIKHT